jgi:hypothetical protein
VDPSVTKDYNVGDSGDYNVGDNGNFMSETAATTMSETTAASCDSFRYLGTQVTPDLEESSTLTLGLDFVAMKDMFFGIKISLRNHNDFSYADSNEHRSDGMRLVGFESDLYRQAYNISPHVRAVAFDCLEMGPQI